MRALVLTIMGLGLLASASAQAADEALITYGEKRYDRMCAPCHDAGFWAAIKIGNRLGPEYGVLDERDDLNEVYIEAVVRRGMGSMPPYRKTELSDDDLDAIEAYLMRNVEQ